MSDKLDAASVAALGEYRNGFTNTADGRTNAVESWNSSHDFMAQWTYPVLREALSVMRILRTQTGDTDEWPIKIVCSDPNISARLSRAMTSLETNLKTIYGEDCLQWTPPENL